MMLYENETTAVILNWNTTPEMKDAGFYGLKDQIIRAYFLNPRELWENFGDLEYLIVGEIEENLKDDLEVSQVEMLKATNMLTVPAVRACVYDLFRQGYLGAGYYIVHLKNADSAPTHISHG